MWAPRALDVIEKTEKYHRESLQRLETLRHCGLTGEPWPKCPRIEARALDGDDKKAKTNVCENEELHKYLLTKRVSGNIPARTFRLFASLDEAIPQLREGYDHVEANKRASLALILQYGEFLNRAFKQHQKERIKLSWDKWLELHVGRSSSYMRKYREVAALLAPYHGFKKLGLTFGEIYRRRKQIQEMLQRDKPWYVHWVY